MCKVSPDLSHDVSIHTPFLKGSSLVVCNTAMQTTWRPTSSPEEVRDNHGTTANLTWWGNTPKLTHWGWIRDSTETLRITLSCVLQKRARKSHCLKGKIRKHVWSSPWKMKGDKIYIFGRHEKQHKPSVSQHNSQQGSMVLAASCGNTYNSNPPKNPF